MFQLIYSNSFYEAAMSQNVSKHAECIWGSLRLDGLGSPHNTRAWHILCWGSKKQNLQKVRWSVDSEPKKSRNDSQKGRKQDFVKMK